jgi:hypothetical protein
VGHQFYKLDAGLCTCILGDPKAGSQSVKVRKLSGWGILLEPLPNLRSNQYVYTSVVLKDGPQMALSGLVVSSDASGVFIQWSHSKPSEEDRIDQVIIDYLKLTSLLAPAPAESRTQPPSAAPVPAQVPEGRAPVAPAASGPPAAQGPASPPPAASPPAATGAIDDVSASIRKKARKVRSSDLASRVEVVEVLDMSTLRGLIKESVDEAVAVVEKSLGESERRRILEEAEESVKERIALFKAEKAGMEESVRLLGEELAKTQALLDEERTKVISASQFTVSDKGMMELEVRMGRMLGQAIKKGHADPQVEGEMRQMLLHLLDDERQKIRQQAEEAQNSRIALLEKKVGRLASSLESAETERDQARRRAQVLEESGLLGLKSIAAAGLDDTDPDREKKLELLKEIVESNREMRSLLASEGRLPAMRVRPEAEPAPALADAAPAPEASAVPQAPEAPGAAETSAELPEGGEAAAERESTKVPQLATGEGADPDDLPWEPPKAKKPVSEVKIKKPGK